MPSFLTSVMAIHTRDSERSTRRCVTATARAIPKHASQPGRVGIWHNHSRCQPQFRDTYQIDHLY